MPNARQFRAQSVFFGASCDLEDLPLNAWIIEGDALGCVQSDVERDVERDAATITAILETHRTSSWPMRMKLSTNPIPSPSDRRSEKVNAPRFGTMFPDKTGPLISARPGQAGHHAKARGGRTGLPLSHDGPDAPASPPPRDGPGMDRARGSGRPFVFANRPLTRP